MAQSHWQWPRPRQRPIKNGLYRTVWKCSYCTETETETDSHWVLYTCYRSRSGSRSRSRSLSVWLSHYSIEQSPSFLRSDDLLTGLYSRYTWSKRDRTIHRSLHRVKPLNHGYSFEKSPPYSRSDLLICCILAIPGVSRVGDMGSWVLVLSQRPVFCGSTLHKGCPGSEGTPPHSRAVGTRCKSSVWLGQWRLHCRTPEPEHNIIEYK